MVARLVGSKPLPQIIVDGEEFIAATIGTEGTADVERRTELFNVLAKDFDCGVGKVGSTVTFSTLSFNYLSVFCYSWKVGVSATSVVLKTST